MRQFEKSENSNRTQKFKFFLLLFSFKNYFSKPSHTIQPVIKMQLKFCELFVLFSHGLSNPIKDYRNQHNS